MTRQHPFAQVDVFSAEPYLGNPVAVVLDADAIPETTMQRIAQWTNLSETTFVMTPTTTEADYHVRIFTPTGELPFAGHPTLGSAHAWMEAGGTPRSERVVQECKAGLIEIRRDEQTLRFAAPPLVRTGELDPSDADRLAAAFGIDLDMVIGHQWVDNGPGWAVLRLPTAQDVLDLQPDFREAPSAMVGAVGAYPPDSDVAFELRAFAPKSGIYEDPVTGSLNASVAQWMTGTGQAPTQYTVSQGTVMGRAGRVHVSTDPDGTVWVGGATTTCFSGTAALPQ